MPACVKESCLSTRQTSTTDIMFAAFVNALDSVSRGREVGFRQCYHELQAWKLAATRLATLRVAAPDASVQLTALQAIAS
eukprot:1086570-Pyramimonas_sp.AAC.1